MIFRWPKQSHIGSLSHTKCRFKKPKSMVEGDVFPECVDKSSDLLAVPVTKIFNLIMASEKWPSKWKMETVTVIPENCTASNYGE